MIFAVVLVVVGLFHVTTAEETFCKSDTTQARIDDQYFELRVNIPTIGTYSLNTFKKHTPYSGKLFVYGNSPLVPNGMIVFPEHLFKRERPYLMSPFMHYYGNLRRFIC